MLEVDSPECRSWSGQLYGISSKLLACSEHQFPHVYIQDINTCHRGPLWCLNNSSAYKAFRKGLTGFSAFLLCVFSYLSIWKGLQNPSGTAMLAQGEKCHLLCSRPRHWGLCQLKTLVVAATLRTANETILLLTTVRIFTFLSLMTKSVSSVVVTYNSREDFCWGQLWWLTEQNRGWGKPVTPLPPTLIYQDNYSTLNYLFPTGTYS